jgi:hypothetical protein
MGGGTHGEKFSECGQIGNVLNMSYISLDVGFDIVGVPFCGVDFPIVNGRV